MKRLVGREFGLGGLEELLDDWSEILGSLPSEAPLSLAVAMGFDLLELSPLLCVGESCDSVVGKVLRLGMVDHYGERTGPMP